MHPVELSLALPTALSVAIFGEWITVKDLSRIDCACIINRTVRKKFLELLQCPYFSTVGTSCKNVHEIEYFTWLVKRSVSPRQITILNPSVTYFYILHGELFRSLKVTAVEELSVNGKEEVAALVKRVCRNSKHLESIKFSNLAWLTYPKLRGILKDCWRTLRVLHIDTIKYLQGPYFAQLSSYLVNLKELTLGRIDLSPILLDALTKHCRQLTTIQFTSCPIYEGTLVTFLESYTPPNQQAQRIHANPKSKYHIKPSSSQLISIVLMYNTGISLQKVSSVIAGNCSSLRKLSLVGEYSDVFALTSDALIHASQSLPLLQHLDVSKNNYINDEAIQSVVERCSQLRVLCIHSCRRISDTSVAAIAQNCVHLVDLDLSWCDNITNQALRFLSEGIPSFRASLRILRINSCYRITSLADLHNLLDKCEHLTMKDVSVVYTKLS